MAGAIEPTATAIINIRNDVANLQKDVTRQDVLVSRFDSALDKISEVSLNVSKLLAVHEQRLEAAEGVAKELPALIEKRRVEAETGLAALHSRVTSSEQRMRQEMQDGQKEILNEIKGLKTDMTALGDELKKKTDDIKNDLEDDFTTKMDEVTTRVSKLERMSWIIIGGATVIGFLISQAMGVMELLK